MGEIDIDSESLYKMLIEYADFVREQTKSFDKSLLTPVIYERITISSFDRSLTSISFQYDYDNIEQFEKFEWDSTLYINFLGGLLGSSEAVRVGELVKPLLPESDYDSKQLAYHILDNFTRRIVDDLINNVFDNSLVLNWIRILITDIKLVLNKQTNNREWFVSLVLANLYLRGDGLNIGPECHFWPLEKEDFEFEDIKVNHRPKSEKIFGKHYDYTTKLEFTATGAKEVGSGFYPESIKDRIDVELNILRLFHVVSVYHISESIVPNSLLERGIELQRELPSEITTSGKVSHQDRGVFQFAIDSENIAALGKFREKLSPLIKQIDPENYLDGSYIDIAFHRYLDALLRSEVYAFRILSAISCMEALLSMNEPEVGFKLRSRLSLMLGCIGVDAKTVSENMKTAYTIRSKIVHGSKLDTGDFKFARDFCKDILNYSRLCILVSIQLQNKYSKKDFLKFLDDALINKSDHENLNVELSQLVIVL